MNDSYVARFEAQARRTPDRAAVKMGEESLDYATLNRAANRLAHRIVSLRGKSPEAVAALFEYTPAGVAALLGVLKAGKFVVLPPPRFPGSRIRHMIQDSGAGLLLCDADTLEQARDLALPDSRLLDIAESDLGAPDSNPQVETTPDMILSLRYTSGSTGPPKGVPHTHRNILHGIDNHRQNGDSAPDWRYLLMETLTTGLPIRTLLAPLACGATVVPFDLHRHGLVAMKAILIKERISVIQIGPTLFRTLANSLGPAERFPGLRLISLIGDTVYPRDLRLFRDTFSPPCRLRIGFGTSESGSVAAFSFDHDSELPEGRVPAGYAVRGKQILILDESRRPVDAGEVGEIAVRSRYLSPGYWGRLELTEKSFLPDFDGGDRPIYLTGDLGRLSPDGCLEHLGRKDFQVKIRGLRIETEEIETALLDLDLFKEVVVVAHRPEGGENRLVAHVVATESPAPSGRSLKARLGEILPDYMVPTHFVFSESLPRTPNGKIIRDQLPAPGRRRPALEVAFVPADSPLQRAVAEIWCELLQLDEVGIHDRFLDVGGDSLLAMRVLTRIERTFQLRIPLITFFDAGTVAELAEAIEALGGVVSEAATAPEEEAPPGSGRSLRS